MPERAIDHDVADEKDFFAMPWRLRFSAALSSLTKSNVEITSVCWRLTSSGMVWRNCATPLRCAPPDSQFDRGQSCGDRRIHVTHNQDHVWTVVSRDQLDAFHDFGSLRRLATEPTSRFASG